MCSPEESKRSKPNQDTCAWITIIGTILFIVCMALMVFLKVGISEKEGTGDDIPSSVQIQPGAIIYFPNNLALPKKTCKLNTCGIGATCSEGVVRPKCACLPNYEGDPVTECIKLECVENADCESKQVCFNQHCVNPCEQICTGKNTQCDVLNHVPVCSCPARYIGNPFIEDCTPAETVKNHTEVPKEMEVSAGTEEPKEQASDPCNPSPCGPDSTCSLSESGVPFCSYSFIPEATFRTAKRNGTTYGDQTQQPECKSDDESDASLASRNSTCVSLCSACGENAVCKKLDHRDHSAVCKCFRNHFGDPYAKCSPECEANGDCPSTRPRCVENACEDPCLGACGINAHCKNHDEYVVCACPRNMTGNPRVFCKPDIQDDSVDFCDPNPCGVNATCTLSTEITKMSDNSTVVEEYPVCSCPSGYDGNPRVSCKPRKCEDDSDCEDNLACSGVEYRCVDPCLDDNDSVCGFGAECSSRRHLAVCTCPPGENA